jgi:NADPH:quinone reductase-like Zn-dependent oxidoreductase
MAAVCITHGSSGHFKVFPAAEAAAAHALKESSEHIGKIVLKW